MTTQRRALNSLILVAIAMILSAPARAEVVSNVIEYKDGDVTCKGYLAYDNAIEGKRPGVLVVHEWWGLNDYARQRADQLAALGYVAFAADMYGDGKTTTSPDQAGKWSSEVKTTALIRTRSRAALDTLAAHSLAEPTKLAALGYCFGGTTVLELAYSGAPVKGVISFHGGLVPPKPEDYPNIKAQIQIMHGAADPMVPQEAVARTLAALDEAKVQWQMTSFSGAEHTFTNPDAGGAGLKGVAYDPTADYFSWEYMKAFLIKIFGPEPKALAAK